MTLFDPNDCFDPLQDRNEIEDRTLTAWYDLAVSPATFDIVHFLGLAEFRRHQTGCRKMRVIFVPGPKGGFRQDAVTPYDVETQHWRLHQVLVPCCWAFPSCREVTVLGSRREARRLFAILQEPVYPAAYTVEKPLEGYRLKHLVQAPDISGSRATREARRIMARWMHLNAPARKVISITLRECAYEQDRNSDRAAWGAFARELDPKTYLPVILRDTDAVHLPLPPELDGLLLFSDPLWNIDLRAAFYEYCYLNLFVNNGPAMLARSNRCARSLTFKMITPTAQATTLEFFIAGGMYPGGQFAGVSPFHRFVWEEDTLDNLRRGFSDMCAAIEDDPQAAGWPPEPL